MTDILSTLDVLLTILNQALCPRRLTCMDCINSLSYPLASVWVLPVECPVRWSKRRVRSGHLYPWILLGSPSPQAAYVLLPKGYCFFQGSPLYNIFPVLSEFWLSSLYPCSFGYGDGNNSMSVTPGTILPPYL